MLGPMPTTSTLTFKNYTVTTVKKKTNRGRKPVKDKAIQVTFWIKESKVKAVGGMESARSMCLALINSKSEKK